MRDRTGANNSNYRHGECVGGTSKLYQIHKEIVRRCTCPAHKRYADYGGRGIDVDPRWVADVQVFISDVGERPSSKHSLDRKNNSKGYWPDNVRWATQTEQANNTRMNRVLTCEGVARTLSQWAAHLQVPVTSIHWRLQNGWGEERALTTPFRRRK